MEILAALPAIEPGMLILALLGAFCLGVSKTGFPGLALVNVLIIAQLFGAKNSVGIILPLLVFCDLAVYPMFRKYASWKALWPLIPTSLIGVLVGYFLLDAIEDSTARHLIGLIILVMLALQFLRARRQNFLEGLPDSRGFRWCTGLGIGISTMLANAAGAVYSIYALVHKMPKNEFLGTGARLFLFLNIIKLAFLGRLELINSPSLKLDLILLPAVTVGSVTGLKRIALVTRRVFEGLLSAFSIIAGGYLLLFPGPGG
jgi:uncharacterized membrane protein YfcA